MLARANSFQLTKGRNEERRLTQRREGARAQRGKPQPNTRFEQEATEETERWTMSSDALFSLFSPVQNILFQNQHFTAWRGAQAQTKTMPEGKGACRGAEVAEKDCMADLLPCFFSVVQYPEFIHL
jgi:hypothetical protein